MVSVHMLKLSCYWSNSKGGKQDFRSAYFTVLRKTSEVDQVLLFPPCLSHNTMCVKTEMMLQAVYKKKQVAYYNLSRGNRSSLTKTHVAMTE
jgi:hypothetical protein